MKTHRTTHALSAAAGLLTTAMTHAGTTLPPAPEKDRAAILAMAGEFEVTFHFHETAAFKAGTPLAAPYNEKARELVLVVRDEPRRIELQHLLVHEGDAIKHWRQVWQYEDTRLCAYAGGESWKLRDLTAEEARGTWTQQVTQTDDSPRYEGVGRWTHAGGISQWTSTDTWRPLPRRELKRRSEYQVITGTNRHAITADGWVHEQDNTKTILCEGKAAGAVAREVGTNSYRRLATGSADFTAARALWENEGGFWNNVLAAWDGIQAEFPVIEVDPVRKPDDLHKAVRHLRKAEAPGRTMPEIRGVIESHLKPRTT